MLLLECQLLLVSHWFVEQDCWLQLFFGIQFGFVITLSNCSKWISDIATSLCWSSRNWTVVKSGRKKCSCCLFLVFLLLHFPFLGNLGVIFYCLCTMYVFLWSVRIIETKFILWKVAHLTSTVDNLIFNLITSSDLAKLWISIIHNWINQNSIPIWLSLRLFLSIRLTEICYNKAYMGTGNYLLYAYK